MPFLAITVFDMRRADRDVGVLGDVLGGRIHVGDVDVVELGNRGMMRAPYSAEFARPAASATPRVDLDGRLVYATDSDQDLIFWMDAWLSC